MAAADGGDRGLRVAGQAPGKQRLEMLSRQGYHVLKLHFLEEF